MLQNILKKLPIEIAESIRKYPRAEEIEEVRIRRNKRICITMGGVNSFLSVACSGQMFQECLQNLCGHSLYSHAETIRDGYIRVEGGVRVGICGQAVLQNGTLSGLYEISSLCIRLPHRIAGIAQPLYGLMKKNGFHQNVLICSLPGYGKTTMLRELIPLLATGENAKRIAVVDTRYELYTGTEDDMADVLYGYPRNTGIEIAIRTLSPQMILCDELMSAEDLAALENCVRCGIPLCATMHASSISTVQPQFRACFSLFCTVSVPEHGRHVYTFQDAEGNVLCIA